MTMKPKEFCSPVNREKSLLPDGLDLRGISCPLNWVRIKLALERTEEGEKIEVLLDDGEPIHNVPRNLKDEGHKLLRVRDENGYFRLVIQRG